MVNKDYRKRSSAVCNKPHRYGNSRAILEYPVSPATRQKHRPRTRQPTGSCRTMPTNMAANAHWQNKQIYLFFILLFYFFLHVYSLQHDYHCQRLNEKRSQNIFFSDCLLKNRYTCSHLCWWRFRSQSTASNAVVTGRRPSGETFNINLWAKSDLPQVVTWTKLCYIESG